jgi:hypothetical protein
VYDVNGDGLNDVVASLEGHGFGLAWYEQKRDAAGKISFVEHMIMDNFLTKNAGDVIFTEPHATAFADIDGNGITDMITGKRSMSHFGYTDPDPFGPAVLYVYKAFRKACAGRRRVCARADSQPFGRRVSHCGDGSERGWVAGHRHGGHLRHVRFLQHRQTSAALISCCWPRIEILSVGGFGGPADP